MRDQVRHREPPAGQQVEHGLEVAPLGPAHLAGREVDAPCLVGGLVAAGAVGPGEAQRQLSFVERCAVQLEPDVAHDDHGGPVPAQRGNPHHRVRGAAGRADQHGVRAAATGPAQHLVGRAVTAFVQGQHPRGGRYPAWMLSRIDAGHLATSCNRQPGR